MAETFYCLGKEIHFSNKGAKELQDLWIEIGNEFKDKNGTKELIEILKDWNNGPQGNRAYDIDDSNEDFDNVEPLKRWLEFNEILIIEIQNKRNECQLFNKETESEVIDRWKEKLKFISDGIKKEIRIKTVPNNV